MRTLAIACIFAGCATPSTEQPTAPDAPVTPDAPGSSTTPRLPAPTGTCPTLVNGDVTFAPAGLPPRKVKLHLDPEATAPGELVIYWHATGSAPLEASYALGASLDELTARGGIVAAPYSDPAAGTFEWFIVNQSSKLDDFMLADEIVGCLAQAQRLDARHIHSMGMSAGALQTTALSFVRSSYVASVATYSGGLPPGIDLAPEDDSNKLAALIFHGGTSDNVFGVDFKGASERYRSAFAATGHFTAICDHGNGHNIPLAAAPSVLAFFTANAFGVSPSPFANGLPSTFPSYCTP